MEEEMDNFNMSDFIQQKMTLVWAKKFRELMILNVGNDKKLIEDFIIYCEQEEKEVYKKVYRGL